MANIVDYVKKYCGTTFEKQPLSIEDALVLAELSYLKFDPVLEQMCETPVSIKDLAAKKDADLMFADPKYGKDYRELFDAALSSVRFSEISFSFYINRIEAENETQFAAVTYLLPTGEAFVAFRGTDESIVGWQEDFGLALNKPIMGQKLSVDYLEKVCTSFKGDLSLGGHSKGGNLAVYSAMNSPADIKSRLIHIYSFDGPGFRPEVIRENNGEDVIGKLISVIPQSSLVGMLLNTAEDSIVVNSRSVGVFQHNPYYWVIKDGTFSRTEITNQHRRWINTFNEWIFSLDEERLERFVNLFCEVLNATEASDTRELTGQIFKSAGNVFKKTRDIDDDTKEFLQKIGKSYFDMVKDMMKSEAREKMNEALEAIRTVKKS